MILKDVIDSDAKPCLRWHVADIAADGVLEVLPQSYDTRDEAVNEARRRVRAGVLPSTMHCQQLEIIACL